MRNCALTSRTQRATVCNYLPVAPDVRLCATMGQLHPMRDCVQRWASCTRCATVCNCGPVAPDTKLCVIVGPVAPDVQLWTHPMCKYLRFFSYNFTCVWDFSVTSEMWLSIFQLQLSSLMRETITDWICIVICTRWEFHKGCNLILFSWFL